MTSTKVLKERLRETAAKQREAIAADNDIGSALIASFDRSLDLPVGIVISGYFPIGSEANVLPLLKTLSARGFRTALPVVGKRMTPLVFREWRETDTMGQGPFKIPEPKAGAEVLRPDLLLTPLLAFDTCGNRLGYGGGFYDLTIATLREYQPVLAAGIAYSGQQVADVPHDDLDVPMDWVITENEAFRPKRGDK
jgi:5-formyltetrahydrofolate cyclo-ligase